MERLGRVGKWIAAAGLCCGVLSPQAVRAQDDPAEGRLADCAAETYIAYRVHDELLAEGYNIDFGLIEKLRVDADALVAVASSGDDGEEMQAQIVDLSVEKYNVFVDAIGQNGLEQAIETSQQNVDECRTEFSEQIAEAQSGGNN